MSDPFRSIATLAKAKSKAELADAAAKAMAHHCDERIERKNKVLRSIAEDCAEAADAADAESSYGEARAWRSIAKRAAAAARS